MLRTITIALAGALLLFAPGRGFAETLACLADAGDAAALTAVRAQIDDSCPCEEFVADGKKSAHGAYLACAKGIVKAAYDAGQIRAKCKKLALYAASRSNCGYPLEPLRVPCLRATAKGFTCKITTCDRADEDSCTAYTNCLDAADTNEDGQVAATDSGECVPFHDCAAQHTQAMLRRDQYINECFGSCIDPYTFSECVLGCGVANSDLNALASAELATCEANRARSCEDLHAINQQYCDGLASPTQNCSQGCASEAICLVTCASTGDCDREIDNAYSFCVDSAD